MTMTLKEVSDHCDNFLDLLEDRGFDPYYLMYSGLDNIEITITEYDIVEYGIFRHLYEQRFNQ